MDEGEPHCADYIYVWQAAGYELQVRLLCVCVFLGGGMLCSGCLNALTWGSCGLKRRAVLHIGCLPNVLGVCCSALPIGIKRILNRVSVVPG
jgi:hypothetical protein